MHKAATPSKEKITCCKQINITIIVNLRLSNICQRPRPSTSEIDTNEWEILRGDVMLCTKIGGGNFGEVYKGTWRGQVEVAIKKLNDGQGAEEFFKEADIARRLHHPNLVQVNLKHKLHINLNISFITYLSQVFGLVTMGDPMLMVMELLEKGDLKSYLQKHSNDLTEEQLICICEHVKFHIIIYKKLLHPMPLIFVTDCKWHENLGRDEDCSQGSRCQKCHVRQVGTGVIRCALSKKELIK